MSMASQMRAEVDAAIASTLGDALLFGHAGALCIGPDAEVKKVRSIHADYNDACKRIEDRAKVVAPLRATTAEGMRAKAEIVQTLNDIGMAGYGARILAVSLARDVLDGVQQ